MMNKMKAILHESNMYLRASSFFRLGIWLCCFSIAILYSFPTFSASQSQNEPIIIGTFNGMISSLIFFAFIDDFRLYIGVCHARIEIKRELSEANNV